MSLHQAHWGKDLLQSACPAHRIDDLEQRYSHTLNHDSLPIRAVSGVDDVLGVARAALLEDGVLLQVQGHQPVLPHAARTDHRNMFSEAGGMVSSELYNFPLTRSLSGCPGGCIRDRTDSLLYLLPSGDALCVLYRAEKSIS